MTQKKNNWNGAEAEARMLSDLQSDYARGISSKPEGVKSAFAITR